MADAYGDASHAEELCAEHDAVVHELATGAGIGGRSRRLGDSVERARKTVGARVRDTLSKLDRTHPALADHLRTSVQLGSVCSYTPKSPTTWRLS
jgi:hypothetical protein